MSGGKHKPSFVAYIDEAGDEGFSFPRSSEWLVLSALVVRRPTELKTVKILDGIKQRLGKDLARPLHFRNLDHAQKVAYLTDLAGQHKHMRTVSIMVHKPSLTDVDTFKEKYLLYRYATRFLLERVSWLCRDHRVDGDMNDGSAELIFSNRKRMSYEDIRDYLDVLKARSDVNVDWNVIKRDLVQPIPHDQRRGLQIADAVASGYWKGLNKDQYGGTEDRYARILHPLAYNRNGSYKPYGLKFFPSAVESLIASEARFSWVRELRK